MRQLMIQVPAGHGKAVREQVEAHQAVNVTQLQGATAGQSWDLVLAYVSNTEVGPLLEELQAQPDLHVNILPVDTLPLSFANSHFRDQIVDTTPRSALEIWLKALQSIGGWRGFTAYTAVASIIVWIGMYTNNLYLLVAAMLIAPFAGPAMNVAIATAAGDSKLLSRSLLRYFGSLLLMLLLTYLLSLALNLQVATSMMISVSEVAAVAVLLPLTAGAAGALNLVQHENSSLVSGTAVGLLVAASLAPPAGLIGMALAIQQYGMASSGLFILLLQLAGINLAGTIIFRLFGLSPEGERPERGHSAIFYTSLAVSVLALGGLLAWQFANPPDLQRSSRSQQALVVARNVVMQSELADLVEADFRFTRPSEIEANTLLGTVYVRRRPGVPLSNAELATRLTQMLQTELLRQDFHVLPLVDIIVLENPPEP